MIYTYENFIERLAQMHPEIEEKSLDNIVKKGLQGIHRLMREGEELLINNYIVDNKSDEWIKFFIKLPPEVQKARSLKNFYKKQHKKEEANARRENNSK